MKDKVKILALKGALHSAGSAAGLCEMLEALGVRCTLTANGRVLWPESNRLIIKGRDFWSFDGESLDLTAQTLAAWAKEPRKAEGFAAVAHLGLDEMFDRLHSLGLSVKLYPDQGRIVGERVQWMRGADGWCACFADELPMDEVIKIEDQSRRA